MPMLEAKIAAEVRKVVAGGDLRGAASYGKPFPAEPAWDVTPTALRMPFKILKDAGYVPPEVELFHQRAALRTALKLAENEEQQLQLRQELNAVCQKLAIRLEALHQHGKL